jgi:FkbM family methyltransferase
MPPLPRVKQFDQCLADAWSVNRGPGLWGRASTAVLARMRRCRLRFNDPPVRMRWCRRQILAPLSHELARYRAFFPFYNTNLGRVANAMVRVSTKPLYAVDVGANIGDTGLLLLDSGVSAVLCVEGSPHFFRYLRANTADEPGISIVNAIVAHEGGPLHVALKEARGTARMEALDGEGGLTTCTLEEALAGHGLNRTVHLLKIDTDGYDCRILLHNSRFIQIHRPTVFLEADVTFDAENDPAVIKQSLEMLHGLGYRNFLVFRNTGEVVCAADLIRDIPVFIDRLSRSMFGAYADIAVFPMERELEWESCKAEFGASSAFGLGWPEPPREENLPRSRSGRHVLPPEQGDT